MSYKIGIYGSAVDESPAALAKAVDLGRILGEHKDQVSVITGACSGMPYIVAKEAAQQGVKVWGFSSEINMDEHCQQYPGQDMSIYSNIEYVPSNFPFVDQENVKRKYRNVTSTAICDAGIILSGRWGTLNEFTNLFDYGKVIGVLTGTGGVADELEALAKKINKQTLAVIIFDDDPKQLVDALIKILQQRKLAI